MLCAPANMKISRSFRLASLAFLSLLCLSGTAVAAARFDSISFKLDPEQGPYLTVRGARTLGRWRFAGGVATDLSNDPLIVRNFFGRKVQDIIDTQLVVQAGLALGVTDWLDFGFSAFFVPFQRFQAVGTGRSFDESHMGDMRLESKIRLLDVDRYSVGLSFVPFVTFPTGDATNFAGNGKVTGGGLFAVESPLLWSRLSLAANIGAQFREKASIDTVSTVGHQILYGGAANVSIIKPVQFIAELSGWAPLTGSKSNTNLEASGGFRFFPISELALTVGAGRGIVAGPGTPDYRVFFSLGYRHLPRAPKLREEVLRTGQIHFEFNKATIRPESRSVLQQVIDLIEDHPEIYGVRVEGHTDNAGTNAYNEDLSKRRAHSVKEALVNGGIPSKKMSSEGFGEDRPIAGNDTPEGRAKNRRVEFRFQVPEKSKLRILTEEGSPTYLE